MNFRGTARVLAVTAVVLAASFGASSGTANAREWREWHGNGWHNGWRGGWHNPGWHRGWHHGWRHDWRR